jgi:hypothetical protein
VGGRLRRHPSPETLERLVRGDLARRRRGEVLAHLEDCQPCREDLDALTALLALVQRLPPSDDSVYELPIERAFAGAAGRLERLAAERAAAAPRVDEVLAGGRRFEELAAEVQEQSLSWGMCEVLLAASAARRRDDPDGMVHAALLACAIAQRLDPALYGGLALIDLQARAWAELGNAHRVHDHLLLAEQALAVAVHLQERGSGDRKLAARTAELTASLRAHQRQFRDAFRRLDTALALYEQEGDCSAVVRVLVSKGLYASYDGDLNNAVLYLRKGLALLDPEADAQLRFLALHNLVLCMAERGEHRAARAALFEMLPLYRDHAGAMDWVRRRLLEGKIAAGLGELDNAERAFVAARRGFEEAGLPFAAALVDLELVAVRVRQGQTERVYRAVAQLVETFRAIGIEREALGAVLLLAEALEHDGLNVELVEATIRVLRRIERQQPAARQA